MTIANLKMKRMWNFSNWLKRSKKYFVFSKNQHKLSSEFIHFRGNIFQKIFYLISGYIKIILHFKIVYVEKKVVCYTVISVYMHVFEFLL